MTQEATENMKKWLLESFTNKKIRIKCMIARADLEIIDFEGVYEKILDYFTENK